MKNTNYYQSGKQIKSINNASKIAGIMKFSCISCKNCYRISNFKRHTCKPCPICSKVITGTEKTFCSKSCSVTFSNSNRSLASRKKQSEQMKKTFKDNPVMFDNFLNSDKTPKFRKISFISCKQCKNFFMIKGWESNPRKFCSSECRTISHMNFKKNHHGNKKLFKYINPTDKKIVILESTWELKIAEYLDSLNIIWTRPEPIPWNDHNNKSHLYYPDFYLPKHNLYLDPKNPYVMELDKEKMSIVNKQIKIIYGSIKELKANISLLIK